ncbi:MAG: DegV family protein [Clostridia bacterium]|nr:DegV family protein [Clostridia bacterium]
MSYVIATDSGCDIKPHILREWGVEYVCLTFRFEGEEREYSNNDMEIGEFYNRMKAGGIAKTSAVNPETFVSKFEQILAQGKDVLYLGFSSGLSTTTNSARIAAEELAEKYPERKIAVVDTLCASAGQGLIVYLTKNKKAEGATIFEAASYAESVKEDICHWVTVEDLEYLKRGGRVSPTVAFVGKALGIKPVIHVDDKGKLDSVAKARGRKASLSYLVDKYGETAQDAASGTVFISHADSESDANLLADMLCEKYGVKVAHITDIGTVIGAHAGPGTIALFYVGTER